MNKHVFSVFVFVLSFVMVGCGSSDIVIDENFEIEEVVAPIIEIQVEEPIVQEVPVGIEEDQKVDVVVEPVIENVVEEEVEEEIIEVEVIEEKKPLVLSSSVFSYNAMIPATYTCDGVNINPQLSIGNIPEGTKSFALLVDDPDAPVGDWVHWIAFNISPDVKSISEGSVPSGAIQGKNDFGVNAYGGPCPPSGTHGYMFKLYALDTKLSIGVGSTKFQLLSAMNGHILDQAYLKGNYSR
jgi:Raf kinase inhibitor-like YbhB/YbcL family protein